MRNLFFESPATGTTIFVMPDGHSEDFFSQVNELSYIQYFCVLAITYRVCIFMNN